MKGRDGGPAAREMVKVDQQRPGAEAEPPSREALTRPDHVVNLYEAKTRLSNLVERAAAGEEISIAKAGKPLARLMPLAQSLYDNRLMSR